MTATTLSLVIASANPHKVEEIRAILDPVLAGRVVLLPRPADVDDIEETGETLEENAALKARVIAAATGLPAIADDTGLEVDALGGRPGVRSARFAGEHASATENVQKLLREMVDQTDRTARFRTVAAVGFPDGRVISTSGSIEGHLATAPIGDAGFGYDPIFVPATERRTFAQMSAEEKHAISHRAQAFTALASRIFDELA